ncbi:MAG: hypothetical protein ACREMA_02245 [Longimicrobiales bacterium]
MTHEEKCNEIKTRLESLEGAGVVHNRSRLAIDWGKYLALFKDPNGRINGWEISRSGELRLEPDLAHVNETFVLRKIYGVQDGAGSDLVFQEHINAAFRLFRDLHALTFGALPDGLTVTQIDERLFGDVLCHYAESELRVSQDIDTF